MLVALLSIALLRGSIFGAIAGFVTGLLLDTATLGHARHHLAAADDRRLLDRPLRRDDRARPLPRAVRVGRGCDRPLPLRPARCCSSCSASRRRPGSSHTELPGAAAPQPGPDPAGLRARPPAVPAARARRPHPRGASPWLAHGARAAASCPATRASRSRTGSRRSSRCGSRSSASSRSRSSPCSSCACGRCRCSPGDKYLAQANDNRVRTLRLEAPRGPILDRNGRVLVTNAPGTSVELWPADLPKTWRGAARGAAAALRSSPACRSKDIVAALAQARRRPADAGRRPARDQAATRSTTCSSTRTSSRRPLGDSFLRKYPYQSLAAQVLGYVGEISPERLKALKKKGYQLGDSIGQAGIEATYDTYLRGQDGTAQLTVDSRGRPKSAGDAEVSSRRPARRSASRSTSSSSVRPSKRSRYGISLAHASTEGGTRTAARSSRSIPRDGAVLAMASNPTYKPSLFAGARTRRSSRRCSNPNVAAADELPGTRTARSRSAIRRARRSSR